MGTTIRVAPSATPPGEAAFVEHPPLPQPQVREVAPALGAVPLITSPETRIPTSDPVKILSPRAAADFSVFTDTSLAVSSSQLSNSTPETSLGTNGQVVFTTGNWYAALSTDTGQTFRYVNPSTEFPRANGGFCCDQVAVYVPSRDLLIWGLQYSGDANGSTERLAVAKGLAAQESLTWTYYDLTPQGSGPGYPPGYIFDFPDISFSNDSLYLTVNTYRTANPAAADFVAAGMYRVSLDELAAEGYVHWDFFPLTAASGLKPTQGSSATMYFATHGALNSVRIFSLPQSSSSLTYYDVSVTAYVNGDGRLSECRDPHGTNPCASADDRVSAAWVSPLNGGEIGVMWNAAQQLGYPYPYVQIAILRESDFALMNQAVIWGTSAAWQYASAGIDARGDVAGTVAYAGGTYFVSSAFWLSDDVNGHSLSPLENYSAVQGSASPSTDRWGDFFTTRRDSTFQNLWTTVAVADTVSAGGAEPHFMLFGRQRDGAASSVPVASFTFTPSDPQSSQLVQFNDTSLGSPTSWAWQFGDGVTSTIQNPTHSYGSAGTYNVSLTASNSAGSGSTSQALTVSNAPGGCTPTSTSLCLSNSRFQVTAMWTKSDGATGRGTAIPLTGDTGYFWFFAPSNIEVVTKVLGFCTNPFNSYWVFAAGLTDVQVILTYTDTNTRTIKTYTNPLNTAFVPIQDTSAFATCP